MFLYPYRILICALIFSKVALGIVFIPRVSFGQPSHRYEDVWMKKSRYKYYAPEYNIENKSTADRAHQSRSSLVTLPMVQRNLDLIPNSQMEFCSLVTTPHYFFRRLREPKERINFKNGGSYFSFLRNLFRIGIDPGFHNYAGVCWWHSRLQRAAAYLTVYAPYEKKPTPSRIKKILNTLIDSKRVVEIPGYSSFSEFTKENKSLIQDFLNRWQLQDTFLNLAWVRGLRGKSEVPADQLKEIMDELYYHVEILRQVTYVKLQEEGLVAHALLILKLEPTENGYYIEYIDSNYPKSTQRAVYRYHYTQFQNSVPYIEYIQDYHKIESAINKYCGFQ